MNITISFTCQNANVYEWAKLQEPSILTDTFCMGYAVNTSGISDYTKHHYINLKMKNIEKERDEYKEKLDNTDMYIKSTINEKVKAILDYEKKRRDEYENIKTLSMQDEIEMYKSQLSQLSIREKNIIEELDEIKNNMDTRIKNNLDKAITSSENLRKTELENYQLGILEEKRKYKELESKIALIQSEHELREKQTFEKVNYVADSRILYMQTQLEQASIREKKLSDQLNLVINNADNRIKESVDSIIIRSEIRRKEDLEKADTYRKEELEREESRRKKLEDQLESLLNDKEEQQNLRQQIENLKSGNFVKGKIGENTVHDILSNAYTKYEIIDMSKTKNVGDLHLLSPSGDLFMFEVKNKNTIDKLDIDKMYSDHDKHVHTNKNYRGGIFVSIRTANIPYKGHLSIELRENIPIIFMGFITNDEFSLSFTKYVDLFIKVCDTYKNIQNTSINIDKENLIELLRCQCNGLDGIKTSIHNFKKTEEQLKLSIVNLESTYLKLWTNFEKYIKDYNYETEVVDHVRNGTKKVNLIKLNKSDLSENNVSSFECTCQQDAIAYVVNILKCRKPIAKSINKDGYYHATINNKSDIQSHEYVFANKAKILYNSKTDYAIIPCYINMSDNTSIIWCVFVKSEGDNKLSIL
jgi:hypothetical protein